VNFDVRHKSRALTEGPERAAARAYLHGIGYSAEDLAKPIVGVAHSWIETMPCNFNNRVLAAKVKRHADGAQHDRDLRRDHDGHLWDARVARIA
jgi:dihydroxyacid dehydratase/phosphogluconate dehydratase